MLLGVLYDVFCVSGEALSSLGKKWSLKWNWTDSVSWQKTDLHHFSTKNWDKMLLMYTEHVHWGYIKTSGDSVGGGASLKVTWWNIKPKKFNCCIYNDPDDQLCFHTAAQRAADTGERPVTQRSADLHGDKMCTSSSHLKCNLTKWIKFSSEAVTLTKMSQCKGKTSMLHV